MKHWKKKQSSLIFLMFLFFQLGYDPSGGAAGKWAKVVKYVAIPAGFFFVSSRVPTVSCTVAGIKSRFCYCQWGGPGFSLVFQFQILLFAVYLSASDCFGFAYYKNSCWFSRKISKSVRVNVLLADNFHSEIIFNSSFTPFSFSLCCQRRSVTAYW